MKKILIFLEKLEILRKMVWIGRTKRVEWRGFENRESLSGRGVRFSTVTPTTRVCGS